MESVLVYVRPTCVNTNKTYEYEFFFSETPDFVWGEDWDVDTPSSNGDMTPDSSSYSEIIKVRTNLPLTTLQETSCYSMEYATYGIMALAWINIENLDEYPQNGRMVMHFGDKKDEIIEKITQNDWEII